MKNFEPFSVAVNDILELHCSEHSNNAACDKCHVCSKLICLSCRFGKTGPFCKECFFEHRRNQDLIWKTQWEPCIRILNIFLFAIVGILLSLILWMKRDAIWCAGVDKRVPCDGTYFTIGVICWIAIGCPVIIYNNYHRRLFQ
jgi:hypothetical protein